MRNKFELPKIGIIACSGGGSNTGVLSCEACKEILKRVDSKEVSVFSLPSILNDISRQKFLLNQIKKLIIIDGCHLRCAKSLLERENILPDFYLNIEEDLKIDKKGPFSTLNYTDREINMVTGKILSIVKDIKNI